MPELLEHQSKTETLNKESKTLLKAEPNTPLNLEEIRFDPRWALRFPPNLLIRRRILPLVKIDDKLKVAAEREIDPTTERVLERTCKCKVDVVLATTESIRSLQTRLFGNLREATGQDRPIAETVANTRVSEDGSGETVDVLNQILKSALICGASDIHLNVIKNGDIQVRTRVDGMLTDDVTLRKDLKLPLFNRIKVLASLDISEKRASQDGSFVFDPGVPLPRAEVRVATIPARFGERITLRLLTHKAELTLNRLGFSPRNEAQFSKAITLSHGMILLTGPTGSGKSTTLYAAIKNLLNERMVNIMTVEDPIEYEIDGVTQTEVDARREKVSFASSLRSILRHDPDVVMLGEIRDRETAELAVRAALTGHLVLSTLHTNTAVGAITRLADLGVDQFLIASVLKLVAAQRLVRELCPQCKKQSVITNVEALSLSKPELEGEVCYRPAGCLKCAGRGFGGRTGLFELLPINSEEATIISNGSTVDSVEPRLSKQRDTHGFLSLRENGAKAILDGITSVEEVIYATSDAI